MLPRAPYENFVSSDRNEGLRAFNEHREIAGPPRLEHRDAA
jgi:hypothetical protein